MAALDLRSLVLMSGLMGLMLSVVLFFLRIGYPRSIRGLGLWSAAPACVFFSTLLFAGRGVLPDFITIVIAIEMDLGISEARAISFVTEGKIPSLQFPLFSPVCPSLASLSNIYVWFQPSLGELLTWLVRFGSLRFKYIYIYINIMYISILFVQPGIGYKRI